MKLVSIILGLVFISKVAAKSETQILTRAQCETNFGDHTYFDEERQKCIFKVGYIIDEEIASLLPKEIIYTPNNSKVEVSIDYASLNLDFKSLTIGCQPDYTESPDRKYCIPSQKWNETCDIVKDKESVSSLSSVNPGTNNSISNCDPASGLVWNPNNEQCECAGESKYNSEFQQCFSTQNCKRLTYGGTYDSVNNICVYPLQPIYENKHNFPCPPNSELQNSTNIDSSSFICTCVSGFEISEGGNSCVIAISYQGNCSMNKDSCSKRQGLECGDDRICNCREKSKWHPREEKCRLSTLSSCETRCNGKSTPTGYSYCEMNPHLTCGRNSKCDTSNNGRFCRCDTNYYYYTGFDRFCYGQEFAKCQRDNDCEEELDCIDGFCRCSDLLSRKYSFWSLRKNKCLLLPGSKCQLEKRTEINWLYYNVLTLSYDYEDKPENPCILEAICLDGKCVCGNGTSASADRECLVSFGNSCNNAKCNFDEGLACKYGICSCVDSGLEYVEGEGCLAKIGAPCGYDTHEAPGSSYCSGENCESLPKYNVKCLFPATCQTIRDGISRCK